MDRDRIFFVSLLVLILFVNLGLWRYVYTENAAVQQDIKRNLQLTNASLTAMQREYDSRLNQHTLRINTLEQDLQLKTDTLRQDFGGSVERISSNLAKVKEQSEQKLSQLEQQLLNVNVQSADFTGIVDTVIPSVVSIRTGQGGGSGVVIDSRGYIVTNYHVVAGTMQVQVVTYQQGTYTGTVIGYNQLYDVAVVKVGTSLPETKFGDSSNVEVGEKVIALGSPGGLDFTVTEGIISARRRDSRGVEFLQIDVPINPGNSGGPLVSRRGRVVGITQSKITELEGVGFAITANDIDDIVEGIIAKDTGEAT